MLLRVPMPIFLSGRRPLSPGSRAGLGAALVLLAVVSAVEIADGRRIRCWGAPTAAEPRGPAAVDRSGRPAARRGSRPPGVTVAHRVIEAHRAQYADAARRPADSSVTARLDRKPHWMTLGLAAAMAVAALSQLLFTG